MNDVLNCLFDCTVPLEIKQLFTESQEVHDSPETGLFWNGKKLAYNWYDEHHQTARSESFDFHQSLTEVARKLGPAPKELLGRALGKGAEKLVWDITGGTGRDALAFYNWGHNVVMFERHPIIAALLIDALRRAPELQDRLSVIFGDAQNLTHSSSPEAIFYDPMYPEDIKKSRPRKEMALFKVLTSGDNDQEQVLEWALNSGAKRIIMKRPLKASEVKPRPTASFKGKTIRFDLWQR